MATNLVRRQPSTLASLGTPAYSSNTPAQPQATAAPADEPFGKDLFMAENGMFSAGDPRLQKYIDGGYLRWNDDNSGGHYSITEKAPPRMGGFTVQAPTKGSGPYGGVLDPSKIIHDPWWGNVTDPSNIAPDKPSLLDIVGPMVPMLMAGGIGALGGLGTSAGGVGGFAGASQAFTGAGAASALPNAARTLGGGGSLNPVSLATLGLGAAGVNVPTWASMLANTGYGLSQGRTPSPYSAIGPGLSMLSRYAGGS